MNDITDARPTLSLDFNRSRIRFNKPTIRALGDPEYVQLLVNPGSRLIAVKGADRSRSGDQTYRLPKKTTPNSHSTEITSLSLLLLLHDTFPELGDANTCILKGVILPAERLALFSTDNIKTSPQEPACDE